MGSTHTSRSGSFRILTLGLVLCLLLSILPPLPARAASTSALNAMEQLNEWGVLKGYPGGDMQPDQPVTRAEFVSMVNRAYGFTDKSKPKAFSDVPANAWYADDFDIASTAGYFKGTSGNTAAPNNNISREDAMVLLAKCMRLNTIPGEVTEFTDGRTFGRWSRGYVKAAVNQGVIKGYSDGTFRPKNPITRAEMSTLLVRALGTLVNGGGEQTLGDVYGSVTLNTPGTILKDTKIAGNLYITGGLGTGAVTLENVSVTGRIIVAGGGEAEKGQDSVILRNVEADGLTVDSTNGKYVSLRAEGDTSVKDALLRTNAYVQDRTDAGYGLLSLTLDGRTSDPAFTLSGNLKDVLNKTPGSALDISAGTVQNLTIDETAADSSLKVGVDAIVHALNLDAPSTVTGDGDIGKLTISANDSRVDILPDKIDVRPGVTSNIYGQDMDTKLGLESSDDPRLLAGYPAARQVAPTSFQGVFSCNKAGKLYWAVTAVNDGTLKEDELITPAAYASKAVKQGSLNIAKANAEVAAAISGLTKGGSYYLSAMLVDNRGTRSPVKTTSFGTPDDTVPNFASGFPALSKITHNSVQVGVMTTKNCLLYSAILPKGSAAPTADDFKSQSISGNLGKRPAREMTKNIAEYFYANTEELEELTEYDVYLWLTDADGAKSSAVKKLSFTTVDGTPPVFTTEMYLLSPQANSLRCSATVNEDATVFWVAVKHGADYPKPQAGETQKPALSSYEAKVAVANGKGIGSTGKAGRASVKGDADATININGLEPETSYDIYYVAQDKAGNYSEVVKVYKDVHTLDNKGPTVTQRFDHYSTEIDGKPYADTNIDLVFSEPVCRDSKDPSLRVKLLDLYDKVTGAATLSQDNAARKELADVLSSIISLYSTTSRDPVPERNYDEDGNADENDGWIIDFRNAEILMDDTDPEGRRMLIRFYGTDDDPNHPQGVNLKSGATYYFKIRNVADTSDNFNKMSDTQLPSFTTISAQILLEDSNLQSDISWTDENGASGILSGDLIDLAFTATPISASTVQDGINWDLLLWSDSSVGYEVYYKRPHEGWMKAPNKGDIYVPSSTNAFAGNSFTRKLMGAKNYQELNELEDEEQYEYVIHITSLSDSNENDRGSWNRLVKFRAQAVIGSKRDLNNQLFNTFQLGDGVTDITTAANLPFSIQHQFTDENAPRFTRSYPMFLPLDETATIKVQLNRPGTVYYVIAPASPSPYITTIDMDGNQVSFLDETIPHMQSADALYPPDTTYPLTAPTRFDITEPTYQNELIVVGTPKRVGDGVEDIKISGLQPNTDYFAYFILQGETGGSMTENVILYKFSTTDVIRPVLTLTAVNNPVVGVSSNIDARVDYLLVTYDERYMFDLLKQPFRTVIGGYDDLSPGDRMDTALYTIPSVYRKYFSSSYLSENFTVLDALSKNVSDNYSSVGSVFDLFAAQSYKNDVADYIRTNQSEITDAIAGGSTIARLTANREQAVDCSRPPITMYPMPTQYIFLAVGKSATNTSGSASSGDSFRATYPIYLKNNLKPMVDSILSSLTYNPTNKTIGGQFTLMFSNPLYYKESSESGSSDTKTVDAAQINDPNRPSFPRSISLESLTSASSAFIGLDLNGQVGTATDRATFILSNSVPVSSNIIINRNLCDMSGLAAQGPLTISFKYDPDTDSVEIKIPSAWDSRIEG